ncbi:MAG TPA: Holliday junction resolvase RuvX [Chloroflexota bacterium]|jgi:putative Holliday junction resolvase|nr:Holliday junction resolvase RuvX [Chloroflexota bacterium]
MGVDVGEKRIGVALSDETCFLASAHSVLRSEGRARDAAAVARLAREQGVSAVVVGMPLSLSGQAGPQAEKARRFGDALAQHDLEVVFWDERLTTLEAQRYLREGGMRRAKRAETIDAAAAAILLQSYLDARRARG